MTPVSNCLYKCMGVKTKSAADGRGAATPRQSTTDAAFAFKCMGFGNDMLLSAIKDYFLWMGRWEAGIAQRSYRLSLALLWHREVSSGTASSPGLSLEPVGSLQHVLGSGRTLRAWLELIAKGCFRLGQPGIPSAWGSSLFLWRGLFSSSPLRCASACHVYPLAMRYSRQFFKTPLEYLFKRHFFFPFLLTFHIFLCWLQGEWSRANSISQAGYYVW